MAFNYEECVCEWVDYLALLVLLDRKGLRGRKEYQDHKVLKE